MMAPGADKIVPMFAPLFTNETVPVDGHIRVNETPGFGVDLNPALKWVRPFVSGRVKPASRERVKTSHL